MSNLLKLAWAARKTLVLEGRRLIASSDTLIAESERLKAMGTGSKDARGVVPSFSDDNKLDATTYKRWAEGYQHRAEGYQASACRAELKAQGYARIAEGNLIWAEALFNHFSPTVLIEWRGEDCFVGSSSFGTLYVFNDEELEKLFGHTS